MLGTAFPGSPRAVLIVSAFYLIFFIYRGFVAAGPFASVAIVAGLVSCVVHILGTLAMYAPARYVRRRLAK